MKLYYFNACIGLITFIHFFEVGQLGCFQLSAVVNNGAMKIGVQISV